MHFAILLGLHVCVPLILPCLRAITLSDCHARRPPTTTLTTVHVVLLSVCSDPFGASAPDRRLRVRLVSMSKVGGL